MFRRAVETDPQCAPAHSELGRLLLEEGDEKGILHLLRALEVRPRDCQTLKYLGNFLMERGLYKSAMAYFKQAMKVKYDDAETYWGVGQCLDRLGNREKAIAIYRKGLRIDDDCAPLHLALAEIYASQPEHRELLQQDLAVLEMLQVRIPAELQEKIGTPQQAPAAQ
jgi:protein O-GlcNAc transferase